MHNPINNIGKLDEKIFAKLDAITVSRESRSDTTEDSVNPQQIAIEPVRSKSRWQEFLLAIGLGLGVSMFDEQEQSNSPDGSPFGRAIDRQ